MNGNFIIANRTDVGRTREVNEDSMVTFDSPNGRVVVVCDGMGGQAAGEVASQLACDIITDILTNNTFSNPTEAITRAVLAANQGILHRADQNPELEGMGATCVIVIVKDGLVYYGWVGDSRIYYVTQQSIVQLSRDQSYVQTLVDSGQISAAEAESHPMKNEITNCLGIASMTPPELNQAPLSPAPDSVIVLCSDGLSGMVDNQTIEAIASNNALPLQQRADLLVDRANANGGADNITVQLIQFSDKPVGTASAANVAKANNKMMLYSVIGGAIVVIGLVLAFVFGGTEKKSKSQPAATVTTTGKTEIDNRKQQKTIVVEEKTVVNKKSDDSKKKDSSKNRDKNKKDNIKNRFGKGANGNGDKENRNKDNANGLNSGSGSTGGGSEITKDDFNKL